MFNMLIRFLLLLIVTVWPLFAQKAPPAGDYTKLQCRYVVQEWNDGDSFHVKDKTGKPLILRLYYVDAPESENSFPDRVAEQAAYFSITPAQALAVGKAASEFTQRTLAGEFTVETRFKDALGRSKLPRYYAFVQVGSTYLQELLVKNGLARIYGTKTPLPDGRDSKEYVASLEKLEQQAKAAKLGAWGLSPGNGKPKSEMKPVERFNIFAKPTPPGQ